MSILKFLWTNIKGYKWHYLVMFLVPIITSFSYPLYHYSIKLLIDVFASVENFTYADIAFPIGLFIFAEVYSSLLWQILVYAEVNSEPYVRRNIVLHAFGKVLGYDYSYFQNTFAGSIVSKIKGCVDGYNRLWEQCNGGINRQTSNLLVCAICLIMVSYKIVLITFAWFFIGYFIIKPLVLQMIERSKEMGEAKHEAISRINDCIANIITVKTFANNKREYESVERFVNNVVIVKERAAYFKFLQIMIVSFVLYLIMITSCLFVMIEGFRAGGITLGDFSYVFGLVIAMGHDAWHLIDKSMSAIQEYGEFTSSYNLLKNEASVLDAENSNLAKPKGSAIEINNINFAYNDNAKIFNKFSLSIKGGEKIGLVGHSGAGKTTLVHLLLRFYDVSSGEIEIGGVNIKEMSQNDLRNFIAHIPQDTALFHRSLKRNIGYAKQKVSMEAVMKVAVEANIAEFVNGLPDGYETLVGERGMKLSGGQRQRIAIARALLKDSPVLILDEATSALDSKTEDEIQKSIHSILANKNKTVIAIAHRLSTLKQMDRIVVMDKGMVVQSGSHNQLIRQEGLYKELWQMQSGGFIVS